MRTLVLLAAIAATAASTTTSAADFVMSKAGVQSNGTHFLDPSTNVTMQHFACGAHHGTASAHFNKTIAKLHHEHQHSKGGARAPGAVGRRQTQTPIAVNVYFHVLSTAANAGTITPAMAMAQAQELNAAYNPYGISFDLINTSFTTNDAWSVGAGADLDAAKAALRRGSYADLNLYFHTDLSGGELGTCTLPSQVSKGVPAGAYASDGCNINANTMPGGSMAGYNLGKTAVHETGHWLGLLHTFEGGACTGAGDYIDDTPMESVQTSGCPTSPPKDSCPSVPGADPVSNYMDYSTDACYTQFTPLQVQRMDSMWQQYRAGM